jgi:hypothetical protein
VSRDDGLDNLRLYNYFLGQAAACEDIAKEYRRLAGEAYAKDRDADASEYKRFAVDLEGRAVKFRKQMKDYKDAPTEQEAQNDRT